MLTNSIPQKAKKLKPLAQLEALQRRYLASHPAACWNSTPYARQIAALEEGGRCQD